MKTKKTSLTYIDLFAGAGGLSEGFIKQGFTPIAHIEMDKDACFTIKTRLAYHYLKNNNKFGIYVDYLKQKITRDELYEQVPVDILNTVINKEISEKTIKSIFDEIDEYIEKNSIDEVDLVIGGPPCQAYSLIGRGRDENSMKDDERNFLYKLYGRFLSRYTPKLFIFENVKGLKSAEEGKHFANMQSYFKRIGYNLEYKILNAKDFGVVQDRERLIFIGWRKDIDFNYPDFDKVENNACVKDIFEDLEEIKPGESEGIYNYSREANNYLITSHIRNGLDFYTQHITRKHNNNDLYIYKVAIEKWNKEKKRLKYTNLPEKNRTHKNQTSFLDRYKVVDYGGLSHTMVAHISKDGHYFIHPDVYQLRSISVREAARIQSFSDDYFFEGSRTSAYRQIGNAVPVLMSTVLSLKIYSSFFKRDVKE